MNKKASFQTFSADPKSKAKSPPPLNQTHIPVQQPRFGSSKQANIIDFIKKPSSSYQCRDIIQTPGGKQLGFSSSIPLQLDPPSCSTPYVKQKHQQQLPQKKPNTLKNNKEEKKRREINLRIFNTVHGGSSKPKQKQEEYTPQNKSFLKFVTKEKGEKKPDKSEISNIMKEANKSNRKKHREQMLKSTKLNEVLISTKQEERGDFLMNLLSNNKEESKSKEPSWGELMNSTGKEQTCGKRKSVMSLYQDPFQKQLRMRRQNQIFEFLLDLLNKRIFQESKLLPLESKFNHPMEFKKQYLPAFYKETAAQILNEAGSESHSLARSSQLEQFTLTLRNPGFQDNRLGTQELLCFTIERINTKLGAYGNRKDENRIPLRENDLIAFFNIDNQMSLGRLREQAILALMSEDIELGVVRKNPQNGEMEIMVLNRQTWIQFKKPQHCSLVASLSTQIREYKTLNMVEFYKLSSLLMSPRLTSPAQKSEEDSSTFRFINTAMQNYYNANQLEAMRRVARMQEEDIFLLQGPPGTGKTTTVIGIISVIRQLLGNEWRVRKDGGKGRGWGEEPKKIKIMVCAPSNKAVDQIMIRLLTKGLINGNGTFTPLHPKQILRLGVIDYEPPKIVLERHLDKLVEQELTNYHHTKDDFDQLEIKKDVVKLEKFKNLVEQKFKNKENEIKEEFKQIDLKKFIKDNHVDRYFQFQKLENMQLTSFKNLIDCRIREYQNKRKGVLKEMKEEKKRKVYLENTFLDQAEILCVTLSTAGTDRCARFGNLDFLIIDEACQASELSSLIPFMHNVERAMLIGDQKQLPQVVQSRQAAEVGYGRSLFERFLESSRGKPFMLTEQYRMTPQIRNFPSLQFYEGKLTDAKELVRRKIPKTIQSLLKTQDSIHFYDLSFTNH